MINPETRSGWTPAVGGSCAHEALRARHEHLYALDGRAATVSGRFLCDIPVSHGGHTREKPLAYEQSRRLARWPDVRRCPHSALQARRSQDGPRFQPPLIKPCMRFSRTRLSEIVHRAAVGAADVQRTVPLSWYTLSARKNAGGCACQRRPLRPCFLLSHSAIRSRT